MRSSGDKEFSGFEIAAEFLADGEGGYAQRPSIVIYVVTTESCGRLWGSKMSGRYKRFEEWCGKHPFILSAIFLGLGLILSAVPAAYGGFKSGYYEATKFVDQRWQERFDRQLQAEVKAQLPIAYGRQLNDRDEHCRKMMAETAATLRSKDSAIFDLSARIGELQKSLDRLTRRAQILEIYDHLTGSAQNILSALVEAVPSNNSESVNAARARAASLLEYIGKARDTFEEWETLFNSVATELMRRLRAGDQISNEELAAFLRAFTSDKETKKKIIQAQIDALNDTLKTKF